MIKQIVFPENYSSFEQVVIFDDRKFILNISWNSSFGNWYVSLYNSIKEPIFEGKTLRANVELLEIHWANPECPQGYLAALNANGGNEEFTFDSFFEENSELFYNSDSV